MMHYYKFNIGDYHTHTAHLEPLEDIAYRRMLDWYYLHEYPLPEDVEKIARLIRMRSHSDSIAVVLREFFELTDDGWIQSKADKEIAAYQVKSNKAKKSAEARWSETRGNSNANALRTQSEGNANHKPLTNNHKPLTNRDNRATKMPKDWKPNDKHRELAASLNVSIVDEQEKFKDYCEANGKTYKSWNAAFNNWLRNAKSFQRDSSTPKPQGQEFTGY